MTTTTARRVVDMGAYREAQRALHFAQCHDWGQDAEIRRDRHGDYYLTGLIDAYTVDGHYYRDRAAIPATVKACREFGEY